MRIVSIALPSLTGYYSATGKNRKRVTDMLTIIRKIHLLWLLLALLAGLVFFLEFVAEVGGSADPQPAIPLERSTSGTSQIIGLEEYGLRLANLA